VSSRKAIGEGVTQPSTLATVSNPLAVSRGQDRKIKRGPIPGLPEGILLKIKPNSWLIKGPDVAALSQLAVKIVGGPEITRVDVRLKSWNPPKGWTGTSKMSGVNSLWLHRQGDGILLELVANEPTDPGLLVAAALRVLQPMVSLSYGSMFTFGPGLPMSAASLIADLNDVVLPTDKAHVHLRRADTLITSSEVSLDSIERSRTVVIDEHKPVWLVDGVGHEVCVNPLVHRPIGRLSTGPWNVGIASVQAGALVIEGSGVNLGTEIDLSLNDVAQLKAIGGLQTNLELPVRWRAQLEACGIVISTKEFPTDDFEWQVQSVHARRHALRAYSPAAALNAWPAVTVVLATHRERFIDQAVQQLARLAYPNLQIIIGLHGVDVDHSRFDAIAHDLKIVKISSEVPFGTAMQQLSEKADGQLITKMDDDDHYGAEHVWDLVLARMYSGATLVGKALDWIYVESANTTAFRPEYPAETYAPFVAGGTLLISRADLDELGGWRPVAKSVDRALIERVQATGGSIYRTHGLGYLYERRGEGHTATPNEEHFLTKTAKTFEGRIQHEVFGTRA